MANGPHMLEQTVIPTSFREHEWKGFDGWSTRYECPLIRAVGYSPRSTRVYRVLVNGGSSGLCGERKTRGACYRQKVKCHSASSLRYCGHHLEDFDRTLPFSLTILRFVGTIVIYHLFIYVPFFLIVQLLHICPLYVFWSVKTSTVFQETRRLQAFNMIYYCINLKSTFNLNAIGVRLKFR